MCETCHALEAALEDGRLAASSIPTWRRLFESAPDEAKTLLESQEPNEHVRRENAYAAMTARPADLTDEMIAAHEADLAARMGLQGGPLRKPDAGAVI
jgi:hypothetical protein